MRLHCSLHCCCLLQGVAGRAGRTQKGAGNGGEGCHSAAAHRANSALPAARCRFLGKVGQPPQQVISSEKRALRKTAGCACRSSGSHDAARACAIQDPQAVAPIQYTIDGAREMQGNALRGLVYATQRCVVDNSLDPRGVFVQVLQPVNMRHRLEWCQLGSVSGRCSKRLSSDAPGALVCLPGKLAASLCGQP